MPAILFKTATKQLHDGYKAARDRLSIGSSGSGSKPSSFSDGRGISRTASFNSASSDVKPRRLKSEKFPAVPEVSREFSVGDSSPESMKKAMSSHTFRQNSPPTRSHSHNIFVRRSNAESCSTPSPDINQTNSASRFTSLLSPHSMSSGISALLTVSPKTAEAGGRTLSNIAGIFHLPVPSFKRSFDSQGSDSLGQSSDSDNIERDLDDRGTDTSLNEA